MNKSILKTKGETSDQFLIRVIGYAEQAIKDVQALEKRVKKLEDDKLSMPGLSDPILNALFGPTVEVKSNKPFMVQFDIPDDLPMEEKQAHSQEFLSLLDKLLVKYKVVVFKGNYKGK